MKLSKIFCPPPFKSRHYKRTFAASADDEASRPTRAVIHFAVDIIQHTIDVDISDICQRLHPTRAKVVQTWPGEHYRLLAGTVATQKPKTVVEIGTETGLSALCLLKYLPAGSKLITFDLIPWNKFSNTVLRQEDFASGQLRQEIADLSDPAMFKKHVDLISQADLLFLDGPKDGKFEPAFAALLNTIQYSKAPWILFDDIRDLHMLRFWRELRYSKLDFTSFGSWTGTGLVYWDSNLTIEG
jgi:predicted O-methyltransferase YrrM